jgi:hypothetical protein
MSITPEILGIQQKIPKSRVDVLEPEKRVLTAPLDEACFQGPQESPCASMGQDVMACDRESAQLLGNWVEL